MLAKDLILKTVDELKTLVAELEAKHRDARFKVSTHQLKKVSEMSALKRDLARIKTAIRHLAPRA